MTGDPRPDGAKEDLAEEIVNMVPSYGYRKLPVVGLGGSAGSIEALQTFFTTMPPRSGFAFAVVIHLSPERDMPARLMSFFRLEKAITLPAEDAPGGSPVTAAVQGEEDGLRDVLAFLRTRTGRDFSHYKRATVLRRIGRRMQVNGIDNLAGYLNCLRTRTGECHALLQDLLITVTNFFRDPDCFGALETTIPALFEGKGPNDTARVWCVACANGEEAYSMAMLLTEYARRLDAPPNIQIFATDLDAEAIQIARDGVYLPAIVPDVNEDRLRRFFIKEHRGYRVRRELREMVLFAAHDALKDSPFSRLDLISCRNLLIYLKRDAQARVFDTLHFALLPGGKLFLGASESVDEATPLFTVLDKKHRIYMQRPSIRSGLPVPSGTATLQSALTAQQHAHEGPMLALRAVVEHPLSAAALPSRVHDGGRTISWGEVHLRLLEHLAPPTILINREHDILHLSPSAGRYLQMGGGEPTRNLLRSVHPNLRIELRAALYQAAQSGHAVILPATPVTVGEVPVRLSLRVEPTDDIGEELFIVSFRPEAAAAPAELGTAAARAEAA